MEPLKSIEKYESLRAVVRELGVEASIARILRAADQSAFDDIRPRSALWGAVEGSGTRRGLAAPLAGGRDMASERRAP